MAEHAGWAVVLQPGRWIRVCILLAMAPLIYFSEARASWKCMLIEDLPTLSDIETKRVTEALVAQHGDGKPFHIRSITSGRGDGNLYYIAWQHDKPCTVSDCYYRILQQRDTGIVELFAFRSNGSIQYMPFYMGVYWEWLKDYFGVYFFEGPEKANIAIGFPSASNNVVIDPYASETTKLPRCGP
jgi:hypothetical protein